MSTSGRWSDLAVRLASALVLLAVGIVAIWMGGAVFRAVVSIAAGLMIWELARMLDPVRRDGVVLLGVVAAVAVYAAALLTGWQAIVCLMVPLGAGLLCLSHERVVWLAYGVMILLAGLAVILVRSELGFLPMAWLLAVVVATDVGGYFGGKLIGGAKFWPSLSPKKTWAGVITGWGAAALMGAVFGFQSGLMAAVIVISVVLSFLSQMGDIAESAIKRRAGVKDSSNLIPGHGGVLDRFDALLAAALALVVIALVTGFPVGLR